MPPSGSGGAPSLLWGWLEKGREPITARSTRAHLFALLAGFDGLVGGLWACLRPGDLFSFLKIEASDDALYFWQMLGLLALGQVACLVSAVAWPAWFRGLLMAPILGRAIQGGLWLGLLGTPRITVSTRPAAFLCTRDVFWFAVLVAGSITASKKT
jgi:hypothetical protein